MTVAARRAYLLFHGVLGVGLLIMCLETLLHAVREFEGAHRHLAFVGGLEALGAVLFLIPRTVRWGGVLLLITLLGGFAVHLTRGEWPLSLLIYAAGVWLVMVQGPALTATQGP